MKEDNGVLSLMVECEACKEKFNIDGKNSTMVNKRKFVLDSPEMFRVIYLTYYVCPECGKRHFVQIDDDKSLEMLDVNKGQFVHNAAIRTRGQKLRKKKIDQYKGTSRHLQKYRTDLMREFTGVVLYDDETETNFTLTFSV